MLIWLTDCKGLEEYESMAYKKQSEAHVLSGLMPRVEKYMSNVIQFPTKTQFRKAAAQDFTPYLVHLGATNDEIPYLLERLEYHFEQVEQSFDVALPHTFPGPLTEEQLGAIGAALKAQAVAISERLKESNGKILLEFARLECELLRKG